MLYKGVTIAVFYYFKPNLYDKICIYILDFFIYIFDSKCWNILTFYQSILYRSNTYSRAQYSSL